MAFAFQQLENSLKQAEDLIAAENFPAALDVLHDAMVTKKKG
jgi:hypothetical protein